MRDKEHHAYYHLQSANMTGYTSGALTAIWWHADTQFGSDICRKIFFRRQINFFRLLWVIGKISNVEVLSKS